ncbi:MAG: hypothetical protein ACSHWY_12080 [Octadecabacter sp.]
MDVTTDTADLLVLRFTRWKSPLIYSALSFGALGVAALMVRSQAIPFAILIIWLLVTVAWMVPMALFRMEKSMLVLNAATGQAELRHRTLRGMHRHTWPLREVQSTRVTRYRPHGPAHKDPKRLITLYVREGMDEGRHNLANYTVPADDALTASARVSDWMRDWRQTQQIETCQ